MSWQAWFYVGSWVVGGACLLRYIFDARRGLRRVEPGYSDLPFKLAPWMVAWVVVPQIGTVVWDRASMFSIVVALIAVPGLLYLTHWMTVRWHRQRAELEDYVIERDLRLIRRDHGLYDDE